MGFLNKTVFAKRLNKSNLFVLAILVGIISCGLATIIASSSTFAAEVVDNYGLYTDLDGVRWEWEVVSDSENTAEPQKLNLMFYDKPENLTTVTVPSYDDMTTITGVTPASDTYYVRNANQESQDTRFASPDPARRTTNQADVTVLDMTNTSKVQIMGVRPIINPETEAELIFGENMVIGDDIDIDVSFTIDKCVETQQDPNYGRRYNCVRTESVTYESIQDEISDWGTFSPFEKTRYMPSVDDILNILSCQKVTDYNLTAYTNVTSGCYATSASSTVSISGAFSGYKLSIIDLENVKYLGWYAFSNSVFNENSRAVAIKDYQTAGEGVFQNTNINEVAIEGPEVFPAMFRNCSDLTVENISFGDAEIIGYNTFENTNLGTLDLSNTAVKEVRDYAFKNAGITAIDFGNIQIIKTYAFSENDLTEIYLPKTINELEGGVFYGNENLKKATIAYDTLTSGTKTPFYVVLDYYDRYNNPNFPTPHQRIKLEELTVLAPYQDDEQVNPTHIPYEEYRNTKIIISLYNSKYGGTSYEGIFWAEDEYANISAYKNIIAPDYFSMLPNLKSITVGDGIEYLGNGAFQIPGSGSTSWGDVSSSWSRDRDALTSVVLPESLKGVGTLALRSTFNENFTMNLPSGLEFIGYAAFSQLYFLEGDVDFPNLRFLGDYAFYSTKVRDIVLHDKLEYVGPGVFNDCPGLRNITFDYDVFNPEKFNWWLEGSTGYSNYRNLFGARYGWLYNRSLLEEYGFDFPDDGSGSDIQYGTITFTDKSISSPPVLCEAWQRSCANWSISFFAEFHGDKIDAREAKWKYIPEYMFERVNLNEIVLPSTIEKISSYAFTDAAITEEIVLPEGLAIIEDFAFSQHDTWYLYKKETFKITSLPTSLRVIGTEAFFHVGRLNIENFNLPNIVTIGNSAFVGGTIKNITLGDNIKHIGSGAFWFVYGIENITIDLDLFNRDKVASGKVECMSHTNASGGSRPYIDDSNYFQTAPYFGLYFMFDTPYYEPSEQYGIKYFTTRPWSSEHEETNHKFGNIVFTEKSTTAPISIPSGTPAGSFFRIFADKIDLSQTSWNTIPRGSFIEAVVDEILLPTTIESIEEAAFFYAKISNELILPDGIKTIGRGAFGNSPRASRLLSDYCYSYPGCEDRGIKITKLPESLETIYEGAFYYDYNLSLDFDLPNIKQIGQSAFAGTALTNVTLHDTITAPLFSGTFANIPTLESIVIDYDYFGINNEEVAQIAASWDWNINIYNPDFKYTWPSAADFFGVFNTTPYDKYPSKGVYYEVGEVEIKPYTSVTFTEKAITEPTDYSPIVSWSEGFSSLEYGNLDLSKTGWKHFTVPYIFQNAKFNKILLPEGLETITQGAFYGAEIEEPLTIPSSVKVIEDNAFELAKVTFSDSFAEGLTTIGDSAFYGAAISGDLVIPSTVTSIGWSAFNAGDADTHYGTVTIKPALNYDSSDSQAVFQLFWNASMDKLVIESPMLPVLAATGDNPILPHEVEYVAGTNEGPVTIAVNPTLRTDGEPEFHGMTMREVEIKNLPVITANAFEECANLETVSFANHDSLTEIGKRAFNNDTKLKSFTFGDGLAGKDVALKEYAFNNTAIETIGNQNSDFALTAANFNAVEPHVFSNMPKLAYASIPSTFSIDASLANEELHTNGSTIPSYTFADDPELATVEVGYQLSTIREDAFANDNKITKLILWGNTDIEENGTDLTIPEPTNIFTYSDAPGQAYANSETRADYDGKFYPLDEVLYLTSNRTYVILEQDEEGNNVDFEKDGLILYALRRDGVILESDDWQTYTKAFTRASNPNIVFEEGKGAAGNLGTDEELMWTVYDAPKPFDTISLANQNYQATDFEFIQMPSSANPLVAIHYPDGYTAAIRTTTLASMTKEEEEEMLRELEVPNTGAFQTIASIAAPSVSIATIVVLGGIYVARKRKN